MIKNKSWLRAGLLALAALAASCRAEPAPGEAPLQGVVELDERVLGFELAGRVATVNVKRGDLVKKGQELASLDDRLGKTSRSARAAEADAARSQVALIKAGARSEDVKSVEAQLRAVKATEALLEKNLGHERELVKRGVSVQARADDLEGNLARTRGERESLEQRLKLLKRGARSQEIDSAESRAQAAGKSLALEDERIDRHLLRTPHDGVVLDVHVENGEVTSPGAPVVTLGDPQHPFVDVFVPIDRLDGIRVGSPGTVKVDSTPIAFKATVEHVARKTEFTPRYLFSERERPNLVVRVRLRVDDPEQRLHAGVPAFARIDRQAPVAPDAASSAASAGAKP